MNKELFIKYFNNKCSSSEVDETIQWFREEADSISNHRLVREIWHNLQPDDNHYGDARFERILDKIHHQINLLNSEKQKSKTNIPGRLQQINRFFLRLAAVLFLPLLFAFLYLLHIILFRDKKLTDKKSKIIWKKKSNKDLKNY